jgi:hypothetical protein
LTPTPRDDICNLIATYCHALDDGRTNDIVACFAPGGSFEIVGTSTHTGTDELRAAYDGWKPRVPQRHVVSSTRVTDWSATHARATSDFLFFVKADGGWAAMAAGRYDDELVCDEGAWRFVARRVTFS